MLHGALRARGGLDELARGPQPRAVPSVDREAEVRGLREPTPSMYGVAATALIFAPVGASAMAYHMPP